MTHPKGCRGPEKGLCWERALKASKWTKHGDYTGGKGLFGASIAKVGSPAELKHYVLKLYEVFGGDLGTPLKEDEGNTRDLASEKTLTPCPEVWNWSPRKWGIWVVTQKGLSGSCIGVGTVATVAVNTTKRCTGNSSTYFSGWLTVGWWCKTRIGPLGTTAIQRMGGLAKRVLGTYLISIYVLN